jgi:hypothetical protein
MEKLCDWANFNCGGGEAMQGQDTNRVAFPKKSGTIKVGVLKDFWSFHHLSLEYWNG